MSILTILLALLLGGTGSANMQTTSVSGHGPASPSEVFGGGPSGSVSTDNVTGGGPSGSPSTYEASGRGRSGSLSPYEVYGGGPVG